jgi:intraflagellar transport protein 122
VCIYQLNEEGTSKVPKYYVKCEGDFNLILLASSHLFVCLDNRLISYELTSNINSVPSREWTFESDIKYLKVLGGATKREALIAGLKNGEIYMIYVDNQFPILLFQHDIPIRSLDVNCTRKKLGIVDENHNLLVIDISTKNVILKDEKAKSIAFNSEIEDMLSYWYEGNVYIKTSDFHPISEKMNGIIVGFRGTKVFLLQAMNTINVLDISHSATIMRYTEKKEFEESYKVACLGATNQELLYIGFEALLNFNFIVAVNCFKKLQDIRLINLVLKVEQDRKDKSYGDEILKADIMCNTGEYEKAADLYIKAGHPEKAIEMYALLKKWAEAMEIKKKFPGKDIDITDGLLSQQADWLYENGKYTEAADLYLLLARKRKAIEIYGEKGMLDKLIEICRVLNKDDSPDLIGLCGYYFRKHRHYQYATEAYLKLGDTKSLVLMNVELERWDEAFLLAQQNKKLLEHCYLQYAESLILKDKFKEAQQSFKKAGRTDLSMKLLEKLIDNAVYEKRHKDACSFFIQYSHDALSSITEYNSNSNKIEILKVKDYIDSFELADIFNAYDIVYKYIEEPFSSDLLAIDDYGLFNTCKYLVNKITNFKTIKKQINGINPAYIYYALAFLSKQFEAFKTARFSFEKLNTLQFPVTWQSKIDYEIMTIRSKPYLDKDSNMPVCYRCLNTNPLVNIKGDRCTVCLAPFIRSPITQEILPLIEFKPKKEISYDLALEIIKSSEIARIQKPLIQSKNDTGYNMMLINQDDSPHEDLFGIRLVEWCENKLSNEEYRIYEVDENVLKSLNESEVKCLIN